MVSTFQETLTTSADTSDSLHLQPTNKASLNQTSLLESTPLRSLAHSTLSIMKQETSSTTESTLAPHKPSDSISTRKSSSTTESTSTPILPPDTTPTTTDLPESTTLTSNLSALESSPSSSLCDTNVLTEKQQPLMERSKRKRRAPLNFSLLNNPRRTKSLCHTTPRWYNQHYIIFLALREHPDHCLSRPALIDAALALDAKISKERNLPRVFRSKTPGNSASAVLTINRDKCYIPYKPEGSRSTWFKLAYTPGNFDQAYEEYKKWMTKLTEHDWPYCFGIPLPGVTTTTTAETNQDSLLNPLGTQSTEEATTTTTTQSTEEGTTTCQGVHSTDDKETTTDHDTDDKENVQIPAPSTTSNKKKKHQRKNKGKSPSTLDKPSSSTTLTTQLSIPQPVYQLGQLDLSDIPTRWQDIIRIDTSTIPNAGQGLFALRDLPYNTPLGFYFGVPMTEYEFDSMKEKVGRASEYSICYRRTVLDATNEKGEPYTLPDNDDEPLCPFHYMNEAKEESLANILFVEGVVVNQVICWSKRLILPGEELFVWYGKDVNRYWDNDNNNNKKQRNS